LNRPPSIMSKAHPKLPAFPTHTSLVRYDNPILVSSSTLAEHAAHTGKQDPNLSATEDILNSILPPREWTADGQLWVQYVSCTPATRSDVVGLTQALDRELQSRRALETGICPIREELYAQCLDELIRQVTIQCFERGLLLLRIRDECRLTLAHYQLLYESSIAFGMRKSLIRSVSIRTQSTGRQSRIRTQRARTSNERLANKD
jgi:dynein light intermediate chain